jgi:HrpA-like RNA helicase
MVAIDSALLRLQEQAALSTIDCSLTSIGSMLARLPVDVSIGKMLIFACIFQVKEKNTKFTKILIISLVC